MLVRIPKVIDKKLERARKLGQTPKTIYLGIDLNNEIRNEQFEPIAADIVSDGQAASVFPTEEPTEYKRVKLHVEEDEDPDYLRIET